MTGFRKFLVRSNLVDLSVAVVVGVAFSNVVQALIKDLITPLIAALGGKPNFSNLVFSINKSHFRYGDFINVALYFLIIAAVIYYFVVVPANRITVIATRNTEAAEHPCPECLSNIPVAASALQVLHRHRRAIPERPPGAFTCRRRVPAAACLTAAYFASA